MPSSYRKMMTVAQVGRKLGVCDETVRRWLRAGRLKGVRVTDYGPWRITSAAVEAALSERK